jgi:hypothetical protein
MFSMLVLSAVLAGNPAFQRPDGLISSARRLGGKAENGLDLELAFTPFDKVVANSQLVVRARIRSVSTRLSSDEQYVLTQYEITPTHFFKGSLPPISRPGPTLALMVVQLGGTLDVDGLHLSTSMNIYPPAELFRQGEDVILCLTPDESEPGFFHFEGGPYGAFRVTGGMVAHMTQQVRKHNEPQTAREFEQRLNQLVSRR